MFSRTLTCENLARYSTEASWDCLSTDVRNKLKDHLLDSLGCALGAMGAEPLRRIRAEQERSSDFAHGKCTLIGAGSATPERATFYNAALIRYLDFMDTFIAPHEACHPSDNIAGILTAAELAGASGRDLLTAMALAYDIQSRLTSSGVPIMQAGFDHTVTQAISLAAGTARVLGLSRQQAANAIAISSVGGAGLAATRTGKHLSQWKGLASAGMALHTIHSVLIAAAGITGPLHLFEGPMGWTQMLSKKLPEKWKGRYEGILNASLKRFNAEFHSQSCIEGLLELRREYSFEPAAIRSVRIDIFNVAYEMIGGGKYLDPQSVRTKEDADHSLHYMAAVAWLDGELEPKQFETSRIQSRDVQTLMKKVKVKPSRAFTRTYPDWMRCRIVIKLSNGRTLTCEKKDFEGFYRRPMPHDRVLEKFRRLGQNVASERQLQNIIDCVADLEARSVRDLTSTLKFES